MLGLELARADADPEALEVVAVQPCGLVDVWNRSRGGRQVVAGDLLQRVNGAAGADAMIAACQRQRFLELGLAAAHAPRASVLDAAAQPWFPGLPYSDVRRAAPNAICGTGAFCYGAGAWSMAGLEPGAWRTSSAAGLDAALHDTASSGSCDADDASTAGSTACGVPSGSEESASDGEHDGALPVEMLSTVT